MGKSKLLAALDAHRGRDFKAEKQRKTQKEKERKKKAKVQAVHVPEGDAQVKFNGSLTHPAADSEGWESDESGNVTPTIVDTSRVIHSESESDSSVGDAEGDNIEPVDGEHEEDIPLSDIESLASEDKDDIVPHQRLTINNTTALQKAYKAIALPYSTLPFSAHQTLMTEKPVVIEDVNNDLARETAFLAQCTIAAKDGRKLLKAEGVPFSRPDDFFAEMVKSDDHMGRIKQKMVDNAANQKAAADARKQRDLKKFGKQVQVARLQERDKAKRETLDKINLLKRKRKNADTGAANEEDLFDVALDDAAKTGKPPRSTEDRSGRARSQNKRQRKDEKLGFGGKKRFSKSTDAASSADLRAFSAKKMKGRKKPQRLGKSRRNKIS